MEKISAMRFVHLFLDFVENHGIFDEYDPEEDAMVTSEGVEELIEIAEGIVPERIENAEAAQRMRALTSVERSRLIQDDEEGVVVDLRDHFAQEMASNGAARGVLKQLATAMKEGEASDINRILDMVKDYGERVD